MTVTACTTVPYTWAPVLAALAAVIAYLGIAGIITGGRIASIIMGADGRLSTSKFQFFLWTGVIVFSYVAIYGWRLACVTPFEALDDIPRNVLIAMGFSVVTLGAAKGITVSYLNAGKIDKSAATAAAGAGGAASTRGGVLTDDSGQPDLTKIQMLTWTLIATIAYLISVFTNMDSIAKCTAQCRFPDIDAALMVLMGLGQGAYLGNKLATTDRPPSISNLSRPSARPGDAVDVNGSGFGDAQRGSQVLFNGAPVVVPVTAWTDGKVTFTVPAQQPSGLAWAQPSQTVNVGLMVDGDATSQRLPLVVT